MLTKKVRVKWVVTRTLVAVLGIATISYLTFWVDGFNARNNERTEIRKVSADITEAERALAAQMLDAYKNLPNHDAVIAAKMDERLRALNEEMDNCFVLCPKPGYYNNRFIEPMVTLFMLYELCGRVDLEPRFVDGCKDIMRVSRETRNLRMRDFVYSEAQYRDIWKRVSQKYGTLVNDELVIRQRIGMLTMRRDAFFN